MPAIHIPSIKEKKNKGYGMHFTFGIAGGEER
jgi:hypothetical protein